MNQVTNLIQWKNLTEEEQANFDFNNYVYVRQKPDGMDFEPTIKAYFGLKDADFISNQTVYRLKIEPDKWYCTNSNCDPQLGKDIIDPHTFKYLRPAKPDEIPKQEKTLAEKIKEKWPDKNVVTFGWTDANIWGWTTGRKSEHTRAQSMRGFYKYVYEHSHNDGNIQLIVTNRPNKNWKGNTIMPVAVLFDRESKE